MNPEPQATDLLLAPPGAGKTDVILDRLVEVKRERPFGKVWVLLPGERQSEAFRRRMMAHNPDQRVFFNVELLTFYKLYPRVLQDTRRGQRRLDEVARQRLLRGVLLQLQHQDALRVYGGIAHTHGFNRVVGEFLYELKQNLVHPHDFAAAAESAKDRDLARIYEAYQGALQKHNLVDREGEGWLALEAVESHPSYGLDIDGLLVDGFDQFNLLQARLLVALAARARANLITLATVPGREQTVGRRFERALDRLIRVHEESGHGVNPRRLQTRHDARPDALRHLTGSLFVPLSPVEHTDGRIQFVEAPDPAAETAAILRRVKRLLLDGCPPDDIVIAVRDWQTYAAHIVSLAQAYQLSALLALQYAEPLSQNPAITALFDLLDLYAVGFRRRNLLDTLRSPYLELPGLDGEWVDHLDRVSRAFLVTGGDKNWVNAVRLAAFTPLDPGEETGPTLLPPEAADKLAANLEAFFARVSPPDVASVAAYIRWIELLIGDDPERDPDDDEDVEPDVPSVNMIARLRRVAGPGLVERDLAAMASFKAVLRALLATQDLFIALDGEEQMTWETFLAELKSAVAALHVHRAPNREGRVLVTTVTDARGLPHRHVFIPGLSEGMFPARLAEDPLYLDSERVDMAARGLPLLSRAERADDDGLFYELISLARETVVLSRPYIKNAAPWPESHLWRAAARLFEDGEQVILANRLRIGAPVPLREAACLPEVALAVSEGLGKDGPLDGELAGYNWLLDESPSFWSNIAIGREVERRRLSREPHDRYTGRLHSGPMVTHVARLLGPDKIWSATQLNDLGMCAFRYYAGRLLNLEALQEPEEGLTPVDLGALYHDILEKTYRQVALRGLSIIPEHLEEAVELLREVAHAALRDAPRRLGFRPSALWEQEKEVLLRRVEMLVRDDFSGTGRLERLGGERVPYRLETPFGSEGEPFFMLDLGQPVGTVRVRGKIDRIDRAGNRALIVDYKTGSRRIDHRELARGRDFQMMLYVLAAQDMLHKEPGESVQVQAGVFWHISTRDILGTLQLDDLGQDAIESGKERLAAYLAHARAGDFAAEANTLEEGKCARFCEFSLLCRVSIVNQRKAQD